MGLIVVFINVCVAGFHIGDGSAYRYPPVNGFNGYYMPPGESMDIKMEPEVMDMYPHPGHHANQTPSPMAFSAHAGPEFPDYGKPSFTS